MHVDNIFAMDNTHRFHSIVNKNSIALRRIIESSGVFNNLVTIYNLLTSILLLFFLLKYIS